MSRRESCLIFLVCFPLIFRNESGAEAVKLKHARLGNSISSAFSLILQWSYSSQNTDAKTSFDYMSNHETADLCVCVCVCALHCGTGLRDFFFFLNSK